MNAEEGKVSWFWISICVIAIAAFITFWVVPKYFIHARNSTGNPNCYANLMQIDEAKEQCALEKKLSPGDPIDQNAVGGYIKNGLPKCPQGGKYTVGKIGEPPRCDFPLHAKFHESLVRRKESTTDVSQ